MADRKITIEVTDNDTIDTVLSKISKVNAGLEKVAAKAKTAFNVGGSVAAGKAAASTGIPVDQQQYDIARGGVGTGAAGRDFSKQAQGLGGLVHVYATFAANLFAVGAAFTALKNAMDVSILTKSLDVLSTSVGVNLKAIADDMVKATQGAINLQNSMKFTAMAATAGFTAKNIKELTDAAKGASAALGRDLGDSMDRLFRGVVKMEPELLDELGIMTKANDAYKAYAQNVHKSVEALTSFEKRQAFLNAVVAEANNKFADTAKALEVNPYTKLLASLQNAGNSILNSVNAILGPIAKVFSESGVLLSTSILGIVGLLLKKAIPAFNDYSKSVQESTERNNKNFEVTAERLKASQAAFISMQNTRANNKFDAALAESTKFEESVRTGLSNAIANGFKTGVTRGLVDANLSAQQMLSKLDQGMLVSSRNAVAKKIDSGKYSGEALEDLQIQLRAREKLIEYKKQESTINDKLVADAKLLSKIENDRAAYEQKLSAAGLGKIQGQLNKAEVGRQIQNSLAAVGDIQQTNGIIAAFRKLNLEKEKLASPENTAKVSAMSQAMLTVQGSAQILGSGLMGVVNKLGIAGMVVGTLVGGFQLLADVFGWNSKVIGQLEAASASTTDSFNMLLRVQREASDVYKTAGQSAEQYVKNVDRLANATKDYSDKVAEQIRLVGEFKKESEGKWATNLKESLAAWTIFGFRESTAEIDKAEKAVNNLFKTIQENEKRTSAGILSQGDKTFIEDRLAKAKGSSGLDKETYLNAAATKAAEIANAQSISEKNRGASLKDSLETMQQLTAEYEKHKTKTEKITEFAKKLTDETKNVAEQFSRGLVSGDSAGNYQQIKAFANSTFIAQLSTGTAEMKAAASALNSITLGGVVEKLKEIKNSAASVKLDKLLRDGASPEEIKKAADEVNKLIAKAIETASSVPMETAAKNRMISLFKSAAASTTNLAATGSGTNFSIPAAIAGGENFIGGARNAGAVKTAVTAVNAAANDYGKAAFDDKNKFLVEEQYIKLLQEEEKQLKSLADVQKKRINSQLKYDVPVTEIQLLNLTKAQIAESQKKYDIELRQIDLDRKKAAEDKQLTPQLKGVLNLRTSAASSEFFARNDAIAQAASETALKSQLDVLTRQSKVREFNLDMAKQALDTGKVSYQMSEKDAALEDLRISTARKAEQDTLAYLSARATAENTVTQFGDGSPEGSAANDMIIKLDAQNKKRTEARDLLYKQTAAQIKHNAAVEEANRLINLQVEGMSQYGSLLADAFGKAGQAAQGLVTALTNGIKAQQDAMNLREDYIKKYGAGSKQVTELEKKQSKDKILMDAKMWGDMAGSFKNFFKEKTAAYKVFDAIEKASQIYRLALMTEEFLTKIGLMTAEVAWKESTTGLMIATDDAETANSISNSIIKAGTSVMAGAAKIWEQMGIFAPIGIGVMLAVMASMGFKKGGGGGNISAASRQESQGTGTVLGDKNAKSNSIGNVMNILKDNSSQDLEYTLSMKNSLESIDKSMSGLTNAVAANQGITGADTSNLNLGGKSILGWGSSRSLADTGIVINAQTIGDVRKGGVQGNAYADITTTSSSWFGLVKKTSTSRELQALSDTIKQQITDVITNLADGVKQASLILRPAEISANEFGKKIDDILEKLDIGTSISFKDLKGDEIGKALSAVFSSMGDGMAQAVISELLPGVADFQKVGEGMFETLSRVSIGVEKAQGILAKYGITAVNWTKIANKQGDVAAEIIRESIIATEMVGDKLSGLGEIVKNFSGSADELITTFTKLKSIRSLMNAFGHDGRNLSLAMIEGAGGITAFVDAMNFMNETWNNGVATYTMAQDDLGNSFRSLGISMPRSIADFQSLAKTMSQDTSEAGQRLYGKLIALAPAFDKVIGAIDRALDEVNKLTQSSLETIMLDTASETEKYNYWKSRAEELAKGDNFKSLMTPEEVTRQITETTNAAMNAWNTLDDAGKKSLKGYFEQFFKDLDANAKTRLGELTDVAVNSGATLETTAQSIAQSTTDGAIRIATAFDLGSQRISDAIISAAGGTVGSSSQLQDYIVQLDEQNKAAIAAQSKTAGNSNDVITSLQSTVKDMQTAMEDFKASVSNFNKGASDIAETGDKPIRLDLNISNDRVSGQVNM